MSNPYVGQIILVGFNFAPTGWAFCQGQLLLISEYDVLFNLIGTTYGGDGETTFGLPDLRGRLPVDMGSGSGLSSYIIGQQGGVETVTLAAAQLPSHVHTVDASHVTATVQCLNAPGNSRTAAGNVPAIEAAGVTMPYSTSPANASMAATVGGGNSMPTGSAGTGGAHDNVQPFLCLNYCISLFGVFPSQT